MNIRPNKIKSLLYICFIAVLSLSACKKTTTGGSGSIEYTWNGVHYEQTDNVNAVIISSKFAGVTDDNLDAKVGDGEMMSTTAGSQKTGCSLFFQANGTSYAGSGSTNQITITAYDGTTIRGSFSGRICSDPQLSNTCSTITGTFQTSNITNF